MDGRSACRGVLAVCGLMLVMTVTIMKWKQQIKFLFLSTKAMTVIFQFPLRLCGTLFEICRLSALRIIS
ncbi:hypothetical protein QBC43DRAFT_313653 [Cladorrhinum sp. PSN259]|nr:hypothetical protein QBC43DRAFT_313653 [Cladorrhinum sp. PSN259]